ncbi:MAG: MFS transporter [Proteobacteria bacterium]|nr:MFS transporter [Pseudomonadota bacterium]
MALGYGAVLPILPAMLEHLMPGAGRDAVSRHTGALTTTYMLAVIVLAPLWGRASDRFGRRSLVLIGTAGYAVALGAFAWATSMPQAYALRFTAGAFAAAVLPAASAAAGDIEDPQRRASWLAGLGTASLLGYLAGPAITSVVFALMGGAGPDTTIASRMNWPVYTAAATALAALLLAYRTLANTAPQIGFANEPFASVHDYFARYVALSATAMVGLGAFEVGLTVLAARTTGPGSSVLALLFVECGAVMLVVQSLLAWYRRMASRFSTAIVTSGFVTMGAGFVVLTSARAVLPMYLAVALIAAGSGTLLPLLAFQASTDGRTQLGAMLGAQTAATTLGQAAGSAVAGWLFAMLDARSFALYAAAMVIGAVAAIRR